MSSVGTGVPQRFAEFRKAAWTAGTCQEKLTRAHAQDVLLEDCHFVPQVPWVLGFSNLAFRNFGSRKGEGGQLSSA